MLFKLCNILKLTLEPVGLNKIPTDVRRNAACSRRRDLRLIAVGVDWLPQAQTAFLVSMGQCAQQQYSQLRYERGATFRRLSRR